MLTAEMNENLTHVGPGTPMGELLRRYWHPIAAAVQLKNKAAMKVRILGEDLALYKDRSGRYGLVAEQCPHRRVSLVYGIPEEEGIRCAYHGWLFDNQGNCLEQPAEPEYSEFKTRIKTTAYPVKELGGMLFTYMGPGEAPQLPNFDYFTQPNALREISYAAIPANWLQIMENSFDPIHLEWLHRYFGHWVNTGESKADLGYFPQRRHAKIAFDEFEFGIIKRRFFEDSNETDEEWTLGHPVVFPTNLKQGNNFQIRVPIDDTNTMHWWYTCHHAEGAVAPPQNEVPVWEQKYLDDDGDFLLKQINQQDIMAWVTQGPIANRTVEHLGSSDLGVITYRKMLQEQIVKVQNGEDPIGTIRDPVNNPPIIWLPAENGDASSPGGRVTMTSGELEELHARLDRQFSNSPLKDQVVEMFMTAAKLRKQSA